MPPVCLPVLPLFLLLLAACGPVPFERMNDSAVEFRWADGPSSRALGNARSAGVHYSTDSSLDSTIASYETLGAKVGSYTPKKFTMYLEHAQITSTELIDGIRDGYLLNPPDLGLTQAQIDSGYLDRLYADFTDSSAVLRPPQAIATGYTYYVAEMTANLTRWDVSGHSDTGGYVEFSITPEISVDLPGYEGVFSSTAVRESGSTVVFNPADLVPLAPGGWGLKAFEVADFLFYGDTYSLLSPEHPAPAGVGEGFNGIVIPFERFHVPNGTTKTRFVLHWDVKDLVEIYDHGTPGDKSDDIIVFAPRFWERISLVPSFQ